MPVMDTLAVWCGALGTRLKLGRRGECKLFESPVPIQAVPGFFSSRLLLGFFQLAKVVSVLALILFETFGNSVEVTGYVELSGTVYRSGFTEVATASEGFTRQAEKLENLCVRSGTVFETLLSENGTMLCGAVVAGSERSVSNNDGNRGVPQNASCERRRFFTFSGKEPTDEVTICNGKVNGVQHLYLNFTGNEIEASDMTSDFSGAGGYVTNIRKVLLNRPPNSNETERAIRFFRNWKLLGSVRLALRAELVNVTPPWESRTEVMSVEGSKRTIYVLSRNAAYCLGMMAVAMSASFCTIIILITLVFWRGNDIMSVSTLSQVLRVAATAYKTNAPIFLVADQGTLRFEQQRSDNEKQARKDEKATIFLA